jgi:hypothetical protein
LSRFEEKRAARIERYKNYSANAEGRSIEAMERADKMSSIIPMGQPILVGHHSEKADRRYREKIWNTRRRSLEEDKKAKYWERRAEAAENSKAIHSDDPEALNKLSETVEDCEKYSEEMKRINAHYRKTGNCLADGADPDLVLKAMKNLETWKYYKQPFPSFILSSIRARIATAKKRAEAIKRAETVEGFEINGITAQINEGQIQVVFPWKPAEATREKLKTYPISLKWSRFSSAWVRKYTGQGSWYFEELKKVCTEAVAEIEGDG